MLELFNCYDGDKKNTYNINPNQKCSFNGENCTNTCKNY